jgi:hypothetical protein
LGRVKVDRDTAKGESGGEFWTVVGFRERGREKGSVMEREGKSDTNSTHTHTHTRTQTHEYKTIIFNAKHNLPTLQYTHT